MAVTSAAHDQLTTRDSGVAGPPEARKPQGTSVHFRLLVWARWTSYRNLLRKSAMKRAKFLTALLAVILALVGGGGSALAFIGLGYAAANKGRTPLIVIGTGAVFLLWQLAPILFEVTSPTIKFRDIARYPVSFRTFYSLHLAFGFLDPSVMLGFGWLSSLWIGLLIGRAAWGIQAIVPFVIFAAMNLLANRFLLSLLDRVLATRRGREAVLGTFMLLGVTAQIVIYGIMPRYGAAGAKALYQALKPVLAWLPPVLAGSASTAPAAAAFLDTGALLFYAVLAAILLRWQLRSAFHGEIYSERRNFSGAVQFRPGWSLPFVSERMSAVIEKEWRYLFRDSRTYMSLAMPIVFSLIMTVSRGAAMKVLSVGFNVHSNSPRLQVMFSAGAVLVLAYLAYDCFGFDAAGFSRWVLLPVRVREVLVGKNLAVAGLWTASFVAVNIILFASGYASGALLLPTLLGVIYAAFITLAAGNQFSVRTPLKLEMASIKSNNMTPGMMLGNMLVLAFSIGTGWVTIAGTRRLGHLWLTTLAFALLATVAACVYVASLNNAARYVEKNAERIATELT